MQKTTFQPKKQLLTYARRGWIIIAVGALAILMALPMSSTLAAPNNQTVPGPTPGSTPRPVPTATPNDDDDDANSGGGGGGESSEGELPGPNTTSVDLTAVVNVDQLNVRGGPGSEYDVVGQVSLDEILTVGGRNEAGDWWFICCTAETGEQGWVTAQFLVPNFSEEQINALPIVPASGPPPTPEPTPEPIGETAAITSTAVVMSMSVLELGMAQSPSFVWQDQEVDLQYLITNPSDEAAINAELRNELPARLSYVSTSVSDGGQAVSSTTGNGATVVGAYWPSLAPGEQVMATITVLISATAPDGAVIQNIAVASADNTEPASAGINIGMPPAIFPDFR